MAQRAEALSPLPPGTARPTRPIDLVHLAKQCLGDENLELEVLRLFDTTLGTYLDRLQRSETGDAAMLLHSIKGAASGVGAWTVAEAAKAMEAEVRAGDSLKSERVEDLAMAVEEVRSFINRMLANHPD